MYYYRARYYKPDWARFIGEDPIGLAGGSNGYEYVQSSPLDGTDPLGLVKSGRGGKGERGRTGSAGGTDNPSKHWKDDPKKPGWGWQKDQDGKKIYKGVLVIWGLLSYLVHYRHYI